MDKMFAQTRRQFGFSRRKKNKKPPRLPLRANLDGSERDLGDGDFPGWVYGFQFDPPGVLGLGPPANQILIGQAVVKLMPEAGERLNRLGVREMKFKISGSTTLAFGRMLAKIAHSYAVAELGLDGFAPLLLDIIKDPKTEFIGHLVGGGYGPVSAGDDLHEISIDQFFRPTCIVVQIRLFADRDLPTYWVVAGARR